LPSNTSGRYSNTSDDHSEHEHRNKTIINAAIFLGHLILSWEHNSVYVRLIQ
jgi:hypothetical protein